MNIEQVTKQASLLWPAAIEKVTGIRNGITEIVCGNDELPKVCGWLSNRRNYHFAGLIVEENAERCDLFYLFAGQGEMGRILLRTDTPIKKRLCKSICGEVHAADWHEREAEDLFGLVFEGHPRLGDFILHDDAWQEGVEPMRNGFDIDATLANRRPSRNWRPRRIVDAPGAFIMPVGPIFSGDAESVHFQLETIGEEVIRIFPRLFFKYRGVEKRAEGRAYDDALLMVERFAGTTAFSHALAGCMAVEQLGDTEVPERAGVLRVFLSELERFRHHLGTVAGICNSTGLVVAANQTAILEEEALRLSGSLTGHRYLFGMAVPGGLSRDLDDRACGKTVARAGGIVRRLNGIEKILINTSSFLDRIEEVGIVTREEARNHGLVGPVARGSGCCNDLRRMQPYAAYDAFKFRLPCEDEGDGYARLRVLLTEAREAVHLMEQATGALRNGPVRVPCKPAEGVALAGVEAPRGATWHWIRIDDAGTVKRYRLITPSFTNWHGFHLAAENFAFQDFPIILATFGLSVAENDR
ncbi:MAG: hypothetical protein GXP58_09915 [Deltaproteobacteria bacterium]|nr:hypothetical protein [Deltaproteobacteria bacterium]